MDLVMMAVNPDFTLRGGGEGLGEFGCADDLAGVALAMFGYMDGEGNSGGLEPLASDFADVAELFRAEVANQGFITVESVLQLGDEFGSCIVGGTLAGDDGELRRGQ